MKRKDVVLALVASISAASLPTKLVSNRYSDNEDEPLDVAREPQFRAVGQLSSPKLIKNEIGQLGKAMATAFLVSPCYIISNNHAVFGEDYTAQPQSDAQRQETGGRYQMAFSVAGRSAMATPVTWGRRDGANRNDWTLLHLDSCLGRLPDIGWMDVDVNLDSNSDNLPVALASFPDDRGDANGKEVGTSLRISWGKTSGYNRDNNTVRYTVSSAPGSSGGVVVRTKADGYMAVIGVHRGALHDALKDPKFYNKYVYPTYRVEVANEFVNIRDIINGQDVRDRLIVDMRAFGRGNPNHAVFARGVPSRREPR